MKKISTRILALLLTLVMVLGAVPFAAAEEVPTITGRISGGASGWPGSTITLALALGAIPDGYHKEVLWDNGYKAESGYSVTLPDDASGTRSVSVTVNLLRAAEVVASETFTHTITVLNPAGDDFAITGGAATAAVGERVSFGVTGKNSSNVTWSVSPSSATINNGTFKANEPGTYTITATATNGGSCAPVTATADIEVVGGDYTVLMSDRTIFLSQVNASMSFTVKDAAGNLVTEGFTASFSSSDPSVVEISDTGALTPHQAGKSDVTVRVTIDGEVYSADATVTVVDQGTITCAQDMSENGGDSADMTFRLNGVSATDVDWDVSVSGEESFSVSDVDENGSTATATINAEDGIGVATVRVSASWGTSSSATGTFHISFYNTINKTVYMKDGVEEFDFDETGVFKSATGFSNADRATMYNMMTDGSGTEVILTESSSRNSRVGKITYVKSTSDSFSSYDPDDENDYSLSKVGNLHFEALGEGEYKLNLEVYKSLGYSGGLATSRGTITIVTAGGTTSSDITYSARPSGTVNFDFDDFADFWDDNIEESKSGKKEELNYVTFDVATASDNKGKLTVDDLAIKATWKFGEDENSSRKIYDLDELTYEATSESSYEDYFTFICYGATGTKLSGIVCVEVEGGKKVYFSDVNASDWFYKEVSYVCGYGIMKGITDTTFAPNDTLTRGMVVTMLWRMQDEPLASASSFTDVKSGEWYADAVAWAAQSGVVKGTSDTTFSPDANITRQDLALMLYRFANYSGKNVSGSSDLSKFSDAAKVGSWAEGALQWAVANGIVTGADGKLNPTGTATRAEAAAMFARFMQN